MSQPDNDTDPLTRAWESSRLAQFLQTGPTIQSESVIVSRIRRGIEGFERALRGAWLYRWLTKEPEPDVIVIDLRDTLTVGPIIAVLDWTTSRTTPWWYQSFLYRVFKQVEARCRQAPVRVASVIVLTAILTRWLMSAILGKLGSRELAIGAVALLLALGGFRITASWHDLRGSQLGQWITQLMTPPEPPESDAPDHPDDDTN